ncbi:MAG: 50S ribosomal protein L6 [Deltaproteobacteria bacterium]|nr:50S ribosomal protein L6 [Deltaproteobacteria bacterium]
MSRIGKRPTPIPKDVKVTIEKDRFSIKGPKGELKQAIHPKIHIQEENGTITVTVDGETRKDNALYGLFGALVSNMVEGVTKGFQRDLEIVGVGYRAESKGRSVVFNLGYSNPVNFDLPDGINANIEKGKIILTGIDKELVGRTAAKIRSLRPPDSYKGKGIKYADELIRRKAGKAGAK